MGANSRLSSSVRHFVPVTLSSGEYYMTAQTGISSLHPRLIRPVLAHQAGQLADVDGDAPSLIAGEQFGGIAATGLTLVVQ